MKSTQNNEMKTNIYFLYRLFIRYTSFHKHMAMNIWILYIQYQSKQ